MPVRARDLIRELGQLGFKIEEPSRGSHWVIRRERLAFVLPLHNALKSEVPDVYVRKLCRLFGLDEQALRQKLYPHCSVELIMDLASMIEV